MTVKAGHGVERCGRREVAREDRPWGVAPAATMTLSDFADRHVCLPFIRVLLLGISTTHPGPAPKDFPIESRCCGSVT